MQGMEAAVRFRRLIFTKPGSADAIGISQYLKRRKTAGLEDSKAVCT